MGILDELDRINQPTGGGNTAGSNKQRSNAPVRRVDAGPSRRVEGSRSGFPDQASLKELQNQVAQYGFRPGKRRSVLLQQLEDVRRALEENADQDTSFSSSMFSSSPTAPQSSPEKGRSSEVNAAIEVLSSDDGYSSADHNESSPDDGHLDGRSCDNGGTDLDSDATDDMDAGLESEGASSSRSSRGSDDEEHAEENERRPQISLTKRISAGAAKANEIPLGSVPAAVAKQLFEAVKSDEDVYRRILLYEPISFDEISSLAKRAGVQGLRNKEMLRNWLDVQCICFYTSELTGQRQRY